MGDSKYDYNSLSTYELHLYEACVNSTMKILNFEGDIHSGWHGWDQSATRYLKITAPGGAYEGSTFVGGLQVTNFDTGAPEIYVIPEMGFPFTDLPGMVGYYSDTINQMFVDWSSLPEPGAYTGPINQAKAAAKALAIYDVQNVGPAVGPLGRNGVLDHVDTIKTKIGNMSGHALNTFYDEWCVQLPLSVTAQDSVACLLYSTLAGERDVWDKARTVVAETAGKGVEAAKEALGGGDGIDLSVLLNVAGAIALIAAPFTDGISLAAVGALNGVGVLLQTGSDFVPEAKEGESKGLGSNTPVGVLYNMQTALEGLNDQIRKEEEGSRKALARMQRFLDQNPDSFGVKTPELLYDDKKGDYLKVVKSDLDWVANDLMQQTGAQYSAAASALDGAVGSGPWTRPGSIGLGSTGPYDDWVTLNADVGTAVSRLYHQNEESRAALAIVARDFGRTDDLIEQDLGRQTAAVKRAESATPGGR